MALHDDPTDFVDTDFQAVQRATADRAAAARRAPTSEELDARSTEAQQKLAELKRQEEQLERERMQLEEMRRRRAEYQTGREEVVHNLTRALGLLEEAEFNARRDAEQMARAIADLRDALGKVQSIREETWTQENYAVELTRALTAIENARMEWNSARLKFPILAGADAAGASPGGEGHRSGPAGLAGLTFAELCRLGLALTWPLALVTLAGLVALLTVLLRR